MAARILSELSVGLTDEISAALKLASEFAGIKPSQFGRQAILEKLVREGYLQHPAARLVNKAPAAAQKGASHAA